MPEPYDIDALERLWETESLTDVQAIGQTISHHRLRIAENLALTAELSREQRRVSELQAEVNALQQRVAAMRRQFESRLTALEGK